MLRPEDRFSAVTWDPIEWHLTTISASRCSINALALSSYSNRHRHNRFLTGPCPPFWCLPSYLPCPPLPSALFCCILTLSCSLSCGSATSPFCAGCLLSACCLVHPSPFADSQTSARIVVPHFLKQKVLVSAVGTSRYSSLIVTQSERMRYQTLGCSPYRLESRE